jgi:hypothetical protein
MTSDEERASTVGEHDNPAPKPNPDGDGQHPPGKQVPPEPEPGKHGTKK